MWIETEPSFSRKSWKEDFLSLYRKRRHLSWSLFILLVFLCDYGTSRLADNVKLGNKKEFINNFFFLKSRWGVILDKAFNLMLRLLKESFESIVTPKSLSCVLLFISLFSAIKLTFLLVLQKKIYLSGFDFVWLSLNHWNSVFEVFCSLTLLSCSQQRVACYHQRNLLIQCYSLSRRDHEGKYWIREALILNHAELQTKFLPSSYILC